MLPNLIKRAITGLFFVLVMCGGILYNGVSFAILFALITFLSLYEFYSLMNQKRNTSINRWFHSLVGALFFLAVFYYNILSSTAIGLLSNNLNLDNIILLPIISLFVLYFMYTFAKELYNQDGSSPLANLSMISMGQLYITMPFSLLSFLAYLNVDTIYSWHFILPIFILIWLNDTGAYLVGSQFGKHRLFERISPKKSWEGFWGGLVFSVIGGVVYGIFVPDLSLVQWAGFGLVVAIAGVFGDLTESMIKRLLEVKDSGNVLPGHGGMLDRFDAILFAIPAALIYLTVINIF
ncbi:MAG: phosphatidate cytidylyltransferase [Bacteroidales bacterium]